MTSDDGSTEDKEIVDEVCQVDCPAVMFINFSTIPPDRLQFYRRLFNSGSISVKDNARLYQKYFVSNKVNDYVTSGYYLGGLST